MTGPMFSIDEDRVQRFLAAGEAAWAATRELSDAENDVRERLARLRSRRDHALRTETRERRYSVNAEGGREYEPNRFDDEIAKLEVELKRAIQRRAEGAARREHDQALAGKVRDLVEKRGPLRPFVGPVAWAPGGRR